MQTKYPKYLRQRNGNLWYTVVSIPRDARWAFSDLDVTGRLSLRLSGDTFMSVVGEHHKNVATILAKIRQVRSPGRKPSRKPRVPSPSLEQYLAAVNSGKFPHQVDIAKHFGCAPSTLTRIKQQAAAASSTDGPHLPRAPTVPTSAPAPADNQGGSERRPLTAPHTLTSYARQDLIPDIVRVLKTAAQARKKTRDFMSRVLHRPDPPDEWIDEVRAELAYVIQLLGAP